MPRPILNEGAIMTGRSTIGVARWCFGRILDDGKPNERGDRMKSLMLLAALGLALIITQARAEEEVATNLKPVKVIADARIALGNKGLLPLYVSTDWAKPQVGVTRAIVVLHGRL